jgi:hypothetical protein
VKRLWIFLLLGLFGMTACSAAASSSDLKPAPLMDASSLPDYGPAPEFVNDVWLNTEGPLRLTDLRGKVVAVDMWTFG